MDPFTLRFRSSALEARYRDLCFEEKARWWLDCTYVADITLVLVDFLGGQVGRLESLSVVILQAVPLIGRAVLRRRGNRPHENEIFRHGYFVWALLVLVAKLLLPSAACGSNVEVWYFLLPFFLRLQGPRSIPLCWTLSVAGIALSNVSPSRNWREDQPAEASAMRDAVVAPKSQPTLLIGCFAQGFAVPRRATIRSAPYKYIVIRGLCACVYACV